jgi:ATP-binding cassette subfamily A (ABC1) protein 3
MAIMVNGRFQCLGSTQHLKAKFGEGYSLIMKLRQNTNAPDVQPQSSVRGRSSFRRPNSAGNWPSSASSSSDEQHQQMETKMRKVMDFVKSRFPGSQLKDQHDGLLHYRILPHGGTSVDDAMNPDSKKVSTAFRIVPAHLFQAINNQDA